MTVASVSAGFLNGAHFLPATNVLSSRTIVGGAVGGGQTSGAVSTAQYSQTVAAPATVHTVITSHPGPNIGYSNAGSSGSTNSGGNQAGQSSDGGNTGTYASYIYNTGPTGSNAQGGSSGQGGYGRQSGSSGGGSNSGYGQSQSQSSYYNQRYY